MEINIGDIPIDEELDNYPEDTVFVLDDRPPKYDLENMRRISPEDPLYDYYPLINMNTGEIIGPAKKTK